MSALKDAGYTAHDGSDDTGTQLVSYKCAGCGKVVKLDSGAPAPAC